MAESFHKLAYAIEIDLLMFPIETGKDASIKEEKLGSIFENFKKASKIMHNKVEADVLLPLSAKLENIFRSLDDEDKKEEWVAFRESFIDKVHGITLEAFAKQDDKESVRQLTNDIARKRLNKKLRARKEAREQERKDARKKKSKKRAESEKKQRQEKRIAEKKLKEKEEKEAEEERKRKEEKAREEQEKKRTEERRRLEEELQRKAEEEAERREEARQKKLAEKNRRLAKKREAKMLEDEEERRRKEDEARRQHAEARRRLNKNVSNGVNKKGLYDGVAGLNPFAPSTKELLTRKVSRKREPLPVHTPKERSSVPAQKQSKAGWDALIGKNENRE